MSIMEELADKLAQEAIAAADKLDDEQVIADIARVIGATSATTEEAFLTAVRVRLAESRARKYLSDRLAGQDALVPPSEQDDAPV